MLTVNGLAARFVSSVTDDVGEPSPGPAGRVRLKLVHLYYGPGGGASGTELAFTSRYDLTQLMEYPAPFIQIEIVGEPEGEGMAQGADVNYTGTVDWDDAAAFFAAWSDGSAAADFNGDTQVGASDAEAFVEEFVSQIQ